MNKILLTICLCFCTTVGLAYDFEDSELGYITENIKARNESYRQRKASQARRDKSRYATRKAKEEKVREWKRSRKENADRILAEEMKVYKANRKRYGSNVCLYNPQTNSQDCGNK